MSLLSVCRLSFSLILAIPAASQTVPLIVPAGTPLPVSLEKRWRIQCVGQPIAGRVVQPIFVFQKEVIPAGSELSGHVVRLQPVNRPKRVKAVLNGDFTPLHEALIQFDRLTFRDGRTMLVKTGLATQQGVVVPFAKRIPARQKNSWIGTTGESARVALGNVTTPTLTAYLPDPSTATGTAVIIAPGGGFVFLGMNSEGHDVAKWLVSRGIAAFVLKYRTVQVEGQNEAQLNQSAGARFGAQASQPRLDCRGRSVRYCRRHPGGQSGALARR
jgi:hypothetical protein